MKDLRMSTDPSTLTISGFSDLGLSTDAHPHRKHGAAPFHWAAGGIAGTVFAASNSIKSAAFRGRTCA